MAWLTDPALFFLTLAVGLIAFEVAVMQFSIFWFFYVGLAAAVTSLLLWIMPGLNWIGAMGIFVVATVAVTLLLNKPLRKWQQQPGAIAGNDAVGQAVEVLQEISAEKPGKVSWSGSEWHAELSPGSGSAIKQGVRAQIADMHGITLVVEAAD